jgi:hypothetical protein
LVEELRAESGYGLRVIDAISDRWGVHENEPGSVWFELEASG